MRDQQHPYTAVTEITFLFAGAGCSLTTNSRPLAAVLAHCTEPLDAKPVFAFRIDVATDDESPLEAPHFRGLHHVVVASFGAANVFVFDLRRRHIEARVSQPLAHNAEFWQRTMLPIVAGVMGASIGVLPVHSACLSREGNGILIAGNSGAGKSSLAVALARRDFDYISDDWTYCTLSAKILSAHGTGARVKLLPDAVDYFPLLSEHHVGLSMNGELAYEVTADVFGMALKKYCTPRMLLFFSRVDGALAQFTSLDRSAARLYLEHNVERLPRQLAQASEIRDELMAAVSELPCWHMRCSGDPDAIAQTLETFYEEQRTAWLQ